MTPANREKAVARHLAKAHAALDDASVLLAACRFAAAASRAYYACFHAAQAALSTLGVQPRTHKGVNERFNLELVVPGKVEPELLSVLGRLQSHREAADYGVEIELAPNSASADVEDARRFVERVEKFATDSGFGLLVRR